MHVGDEVPLVTSGSSLSDALVTLSDKGLGCVGVTQSDGQLIGMLTDGDIRRLLSAGQSAETVDDAMTKSPTTTTADTLASSLLSVLNEKRITQIFVVRDGRPIGIIHMHDLLKAGVT
jgi:arabinose-5-phosphate isomerase